MNRMRIARGRPFRDRALTACALTCVALVLGVLASPSTAYAVGDPNYVVKVTDANVTQGQVFDLEVRLDVFGDECQGWSFGICHTDVLLEILEVVDSPLTLTIKNGNPPDFNALSVYDGGFTKGVLICFTGCAALAPGADWHLNTATYQALAPGPLTTGVSPCSTLGSPVVPVRVVVDGTTIDATRETGVVQIFFGSPPTIHVLQGGQGFGIYDPSNGVTSASVPMFIDESELSPGFPNPVSAFEMAVRFDPGLMTLTSVDMGSSLAALNGGSGPELFLPTIVAEGVMVDCVIESAGGGDLLLAPDPAEVALLNFDANPTPLTFNPFGIHFPLEFDPTIDPMAANSVTVDDPVAILQLSAGMVHFVPREQFVRGDANNDGLVQISDVLCVLDRVFSGAVLPCDDAADINDDHHLNVADGVALLEFLFMLGPDLPHPFPECGWDTTGAVDCLIYNGCP